MNDILTARELTMPAITHAFFTRDWGNGGYIGDENPGGRERMAAQIGVEPLNLLTCDQRHTMDVAAVTQSWTFQTRPVADALVTDRTGVALGVLTADCVPILFADARAGVIGAAHAGWRGAVGGVIDNTLQAMEGLGGKRADIVAALGPCIWQASYEVGPEFSAPFLAEDKNNARFFVPSLKAEHFLFDLPGYAIAKLRRLGVERVSPSPADTCADPQRFFSHRYSTLRQQPRGGNLLAAIALTGKTEPA